MIKDFVFNNLVYMLATIIIGVANWLFGFWILTYTTPEITSVYNSFAAILLLFALPGRWVTLLTIRLGDKFLTYVNDLIANNKLIAGFSALVFVAALSIMVVVSQLPWITLGYFLGIITFSTIVAFYKGLLQNRTKFATLSWVGVLEVFVKLGILWPLMFTALIDQSMFLAILLAFVATTVLLWWMLPLKSNGNVSTEAIVGDGVLSFFYGFGYLFATNLDLIMARINLDLAANEAYIGLTLVVKLLLFGAIALVNVLLPSIQKYSSGGQIARLSLLTTGGIVAGTVVVLIAVSGWYEFFSESFKFTEVSLEFAQLMIVSAMIFALAQIPLSILFVKRDNGVIWTTMVAAVVQLVLYLAVGFTLESFIWVFALTALVTSIMATFYAMRYFSISKFTNYFSFS